MQLKLQERLLNRRGGVLRQWRALHRLPWMEGPTELLAILGQELLQAMRFETDLVVEMLSLVGERCRRSNRVIGLLLSGIEDMHRNQEERLQLATNEVGGIHCCVAKASQQLQQLHEKT